MVLKDNASKLKTRSFESRLNSPLLRRNKTLMCSILILIVPLSTFTTAPDYESLNRLYQKHLQNAKSLVAVDGWPAIDQSVFHLLSAEDGSMGGARNRTPGSDDHDGPARQIGLCPTRGHRPFCVDSHANLVGIQIGRYS